MFASHRRNLTASLATALALAFAAGVRANYAPLPSFEAEHVWVYAGKGWVQPLFASTDEAQHAKQISFNEILRLKIIGFNYVGGKDAVKMEERDSLFGRVRKYASVPGPTDSLRDTVIVRTLVYTRNENKYYLAKGDSLGFGHRDSMDLFFWSIGEPAFRVEPLKGLSAPWQGMSSNIPQNNRAATWTDGDAWYLDGVGLYWARLGTACDQCGCHGSRELMLQSFDGKAVDPGVDPPGTALAKGSRIACGLKRPARRGPSYLRPGSNIGINALGRTLPATATSGGAGPKP